jgi:hypothetical protein
MDICSSDDEDDMSMTIDLNRVETLRNFEAVVVGIGMFYTEIYLNKAARRQPVVCGFDWVMRTLNDPNEFYEMLRMSRPLFDRLHDLLVSSYGLASSSKMTSI